MKRKNSAGVRKAYPRNGYKPKGVKHSKSSPWKGKTYEEIFGVQRAKEIKRKIQQTSIGRSTWQMMSENARQKHRENTRQRILKRYEDGWQPKAGRCRKIPYLSQISGRIFVDGKWELLVAQYLDVIGVHWKRNKIRFPYQNLKFTTSHYTPDFWVEDWKSFIEVKGYETDLDRCKWSQFPENLIIWKKAEIGVITKYLRGEVS